MATTKELQDILNNINANRPADYTGNVTSDETKNYQQKVNSLENNKPTEYQSQYQNKITEVMNKINNREQFSYDFNADPLYQNYKDQYTKLGNEAAQNAAASVSALTGGYGNSYATTAASQANQQYLTQLNDVIPELYNAALNKYQMETEDLYNQFSMYGTQEDREYNKYRDTVSDYQADRSYYANQLANSQSNDQWNNTFNYNKYRDTVTDWENNRNYYTDMYNNSVSNDQWQAEFDYQKQRDAVSDQQWAAEYALSQAAQQASARSSGSSGSSSKSSKTTSTAKALTTDEINYLIGASKGKGSAKQQYNNVKNALAQAVSDGRLTQSQAQQVLQTAQWYTAQMK